jgi:hypothetical protein
MHRSKRSAAAAIAGGVALAALIGFGAMTPEAPRTGTPPSGHADHAPAPAGRPAATPIAAPAAVLPGQPAATLRPDPLDAPAATSVAEAQGAAAMAREMAGHAGHGAGAYRQVDAGRGPVAQPERSEEQEHKHEHEHQPPDGGGTGRRR